MRMSVFAGALALAAIGSLCVLPADAAELGSYPEQHQASAQINISRVKSVLRLTPAQEGYWPPVEAALRDIARNQARHEAEGFVRRVSHRVVSIVLDSAAVERLAVAARPLIAALSDEQRHAAQALAREMGLGPVVAALN